jgi:hypothetical protein
VHRLYLLGDDSGFASAMETLLDDLEAATEMGRAAREAVLCAHSWKSGGAQVVARASYKNPTPGARGCG